MLSAETVGMIDKFADHGGSDKIAHPGNETDAADNVAKYQPERLSEGIRYLHSFPLSITVQGGLLSIAPGTRAASLPHAGESFEQSLRLIDGQRTHRPFAHIGSRFSVDETFAGSRVVARQRSPGGHRYDHPVGQGYVVNSTPQRVEWGGAVFSDEDDLQRLCQQLDVVEQGGEREKIAAHLSGKRLQDRLGATSIGLFAGQYCEPRQHADQGPVAGGYGRIGGRLGMRDEAFGIPCGEEIAAFG